jgi:preprotein translocase subunit YajC
MTINDLTNFFFLAQEGGGADGAGAQSGGGGFQLMIFMVLMFVMMYFLTIRPQRQKQKQLQAQISALKTGDKIVTSGGIHGLVTNLKETSVMLKIADNVKIEIEKPAVATVLPKAVKDADADSTSEEESKES